MLDYHFNQDTISPKPLLFLNTAIVVGLETSQGKGQWDLV